MKIDESKIGRRADASSAGLRARSEALAAQALMFLTLDEDRLTRFLALTGLDPASIRQSARAPDFLGAVMAYVASDEALLIAFASHERLAPEAVARAIAYFEHGR